MEFSFTQVISKYFLYFKSYTYFLFPSPFYNSVRNFTGSKKHEKCFAITVALNECLWKPHSHYESSNKKRWLTGDPEILDLIQFLRIH